MKRLLLFSALLALTATASFGQTRRVFTEEFTGSWCGWCPRGALALEQADQHYPGRAIGVAVHNADPMAFPQADSITSGKGFPAMSVTSGFPSGWVARRPVSGTWVTDPMNWVDSSSWSTGLIDQAMLETPKATVSMSNIHFDATTGMVTVDVEARFQQSMSGDFRLNVIVTEDSVTGAANSTWDQHNYYYHRTGMEQSPYFNVGTGAAGNATIPNYVYYHVFREAVAGVHGGTVASAVSPGQQYTKTFSFRLPYTIQDPNHVNLVAIVHQFSATDGTKDEVFDAEQQPLSTTPINIVKSDYTFNPEAGYNPETSSTYVTALSNGDSTQTITFFNSDAADTKLSIAVDQSALPEGWSYTVDPTSVTVPSFSSASVTLKIHAPSQANFVVAKLMVTPTATGAWGATSVYPVYSLSSDTKQAILYFSTPEYATLNSMPSNLVATTAVMPASEDVFVNYPIADMDLVTINSPYIDNFGGGLPSANILQTVEDMLNNGKKVMLTTDLGLYYSLDPGSQYGSSDGATFWGDSLGLTYRSLVQHVANNAYTSFKVTATSDPISKGLTTTANTSGTIGYEQYTSSFDVDKTKSTPLFYFDASAANNAGIKYENSNGGRLVYLGFNLNSLGSQVNSSGQIIANNNAIKIATNSINWLLAPAGSVAQPQMTNEGMFATENPFVGRTEVRYTPEADEANVSFSAYDLLGHEVATMPAKMVNGAYTTTFNASGLASGTYTIVAHTSKGAHQIRVVAE